jgi:hypothetical protein
MGEAGREVLLPLTNPGRALDLARESGALDVLAQQLARAGGSSTPVRSPTSIPSAGTSITVQEGAVQVILPRGTSRAEAEAAGEAAGSGFWRSVQERRVAGIARVR